MERQWLKGSVDTEREHLRLCFGDEWEPVALVASHGETRFVVEFLLDPSRDPSAAEAVDAVRGELDFYFIEKKEVDAWSYAVKHCRTASNLYSSVHWEHYAPSTSRQP